MENVVVSGRAVAPQVPIITIICGLYSDIFNALLCATAAVEFGLSIHAFLAIIYEFYDCYYGIIDYLFIFIHICCTSMQQEI